MCRKDYFMNTKIDKIKLTNVPVAKIDDPDRLRKDGILIKDKKGQNYIAGSGQKFTRLTVKDKVVDQYVVGYDSLHHAPYTKMELSVKKKNGNLECNSVADTYSQMLHTQEHLLEEYGIVTDCTDAKISYLEINRTFPLNGRFADYKRVFILLMSRLPKNKGVQIDFKNIIDNSYVLDEYVATNNSSAIKIYNKSSQLKLELTEDILRAEITLKKAQSVKRAFGSNQLNDLTDSMVDEYFISKMQKLFVKPVQKWKKLRDKKILNLIRKMKEKEHHWVGSVLGTLQNEEILTGIPAVLDVNELLPVLDQIVASRRKARTKKQFQDQATKVYTAFDRRDDIKLEEVLRKMCTTSKLMCDQ